MAKVPAILLFGKIICSSCLITDFFLFLTRSTEWFLMSFMDCGLSIGLSKKLFAL